MTTFSDTLSNFIKEKKIKINDMINYVDIDRSTFYKIVKGKRNPSNRHIVEKMIAYLRLSQKEVDQMWQDYEITILGAYTYFRRKHIKLFLKESITSMYNDTPEILESTPHYQSVKDFPDFFNVIGDYNVNLTISQVLNLEMSREHPLLKICVQPDHQFIMSGLNHFIFKNRKAHIEHLFCLDNTESMNANHLIYNLDYFSHVMPLLLYGDNYVPYCYYNHIMTKENQMSFYENVMITQDFVFTFTRDCQNGILFKNQEIIQSYQTIFNRYLKETQPLTKLIQYTDYWRYTQDILHKNYQTPCYSYATQPCITLIFDPKICNMRKCIPEDFFNIDEFEKIFYNFANSFREQLYDNEFKLLFTPQGLEYFVKEGISDELPFGFDIVCDIEDRLNALKEWRSFMARYDCLLMIHDDAMPKESSMYFLFSPNVGFISPMTQTGNFYSISIEETSLISAFYDYLQNLAEKCAYSKQETIDLFTQYIHYLEAELAKEKEQAQ